MAKRVSVDRSRKEKAKVDYFRICAGGLGGDRGREKADSSSCERQWYLKIIIGTAPGSCACGEPRLSCDFGPGVVLLCEPRTLQHTRWNRRERRGDMASHLEHLWEEAFWRRYSDLDA